MIEYPRNARRHAVKQITRVYYSIYGATLLMAVGIIFLNMKGIVLSGISANLNITISSLVIIYILCSLPLGLGGFFWLTKKWIKLNDEALKIKKYTRASNWRLVIIGFGLFIGIISFYLLQSTSMIFCAAISAIALIFCKPSEEKIVAELDLEDIEN